MADGVIGVLFISALLLAWVFWSPGEEITDGRHDRRQNGIWISHGWLGADEWFLQHDKTNEFVRYRSLTNVALLAIKLREHGITDVFPHLSPADERGNLHAIDDEQTTRFLAEFKGLRVIPWIGGPWGTGARPWDGRWRTNFIAEIRRLLQRHPGFAGIQLNIEPIPAGDTNLISLTAEIKAALPPDKILSFAAYPPPTYWHQFPDVHWSEDYFRAIPANCDQLAVMMYDTGLRNPRLYRKLMSDWTYEALSWSGETSVLLGVPAYADEGVEYHFPEVENITNAISGIHSGLLKTGPPANYQGIVIYADWVTEPDEWRFLSRHFFNRSSNRRQ